MNAKNKFLFEQEFYLKVIFIPLQNIRQTDGQMWKQYTTLPTQYKWSKKESF